jgi:hypothetical protein
MKADGPAPATQAGDELAYPVRRAQIGEPHRGVEAHLGVRMAQGCAKVCSLG